METLPLFLVSLELRKGLHSSMSLLRKNTLQLLFAVQGRQKGDSWPTSRARMGFLIIFVYILCNPSTQTLCSRASVQCFHSVGLGALKNRVGCHCLNMQSFVQKSGQYEFWIVYNYQWEPL